MEYWVTLTPADIAAVLVHSERDTVLSPAHGSAVKTVCEDVICLVREAVASNRANRMSADPARIPRSLRPAALDIIRLRLLTRFALSVTEERQEAAERAEQELEAVRTGKRAILAEDGTLPDEPCAIPAIIAPTPAYGNDGVGWYPVP